MSDEKPDQNQHEGKEGKGRLSRRRFLAGGAAFGGAIVWTPAAFGRLAKPLAPSSGNPCDDIRVLRADVEKSNVKRRLKNRLLSILGDAAEQCVAHHNAKACKKLSRFEAVTSQETTQPGGPSGSQASNWIERSEKIKAELGCPSATAV
jgi:hypothetical protein